MAHGQTARRLRSGFKAVVEGVAAPELFIREIDVTGPRAGVINWPSHEIIPVLLFLSFPLLICLI